MTVVIFRLPRLYLVPLLLSFVVVVGFRACGFRKVGVKARGSKDLVSLSRRYIVYQDK